MSERILQVLPSNIQRRMQNGEPVTLIDVRSPLEYKSGHVRGAISLPLDELEPSELERRTGTNSIGTEIPLYLTCQSGLRAQQAANKLQDAGYSNLVLMEGGTSAWEQAGLPMRRSGTSLSLQQQVHITIGSLLILKVIFGFAVSELFFVFAALIGAGLITAGLTRWCGMAQLLARMPWNRESQKLQKEGVTDVN
ncbi:MAG: rhodanese-like domain-containing protein [Gammaproteobacteria bacterium]|nr:rhodanese-like domain-containing protein [Gammaproteobacteria bacterium]